MSTEARKRENLAVEICVLWNGALEEVEHIPLTEGAGASFAIGEAFDCDFPVPNEDLAGATRFPLVEIDDRGRVKLEVPPGARLRGGGARRTREGRTIALAPGRRVQLALGALAFEVEVVEMPEWASPRRELNKITSMAFAFSVLFHAGTAATFALLPPLPEPLTLEELAAHNRYVAIMLLDAEPTAVASPSPQWLSRDPTSDDESWGLRHRGGEEGLLDARYEAKQMVREAGILTYLSQVNEPASPFGSDPESSLGAMIGDGRRTGAVGGHYGIRGTGRGGGGYGDESHGRPERAYVSPDGRAGVTADGRPYVLLDPSDPGPATADETRSAERYERLHENPFLDAETSPVSTFAIDVDTASYTNARRFLSQDALPPPAAVRIEEMINYFSYDYDPPGNGDPFAVDVEVADCPWRPDHRLVRIGLKGRELHSRPRANLVFLIDVSGSMDEPDKLPLLKAGMRMLVDQLDYRDRVAIVTYAGFSGLALPSTPVRERAVILAAIDRLRAEGSTNGGAGIRLAYRIANENFVEGGVNRVILATDGDFNVGVTDRDELTTLIETAATSGVFLTTLGFGTDNLNDALLERLADRGNGHYAYLDSLAEAHKVLEQQVSGTIVTIAKDVKIQVEFNPEQVESYRLIGYENRLLAAEDFDDDWKDAGEIGAGHAVTALYQVAPATSASPTLRADELLTLKLRYKQPDREVSELLVYDVYDLGSTIDETSPDFRFAAAVAGLGMLLRGSSHRGLITAEGVIELAESGLGRDSSGYREQFVEIARKARDLGVGDPDPTARDRS